MSAATQDSEELCVEAETSDGLASTSSIELEDDREFDPELPTEMESSVQTTPAKDVVIEKENAATDYGKSEKKVPAKPTTESTESVMV